MTQTHPDDVTAILTNDHHEVLDLIGAIPAMTEPYDRRAAADTVIAEIIRHSVAEEMFVYPAMRDHLPDGRSIVEHDIEEHAALETSLKALEGTAGDDPNFFAQLDLVEQQLRAHAEDEEQNQFPQLRMHFPADELVDLGRKVQDAKQIAPTRPHPASPHSELFHKLVGPGVGLVDRLRDAVSGRSRNV